MSYIMSIIEDPTLGTGEYAQGIDDNLILDSIDDVIRTLVNYLPIHFGINRNVPLTVNVTFDNKTLLDCQISDYFLKYGYECKQPKNSCCQFCDKQNMCMVIGVKISNLKQKYTDMKRVWISAEALKQHMDFVDAYF